MQGRGRRVYRHILNASDDTRAKKIASKPYVFLCQPARAADFSYLKASLRDKCKVLWHAYHARSVEVLIALLCPPIIILAGWCVMQLISHFTKVKPLFTRKSCISRFAIIFLLLASYVIVIPCEMWLLAAEGGNQAIPLSQNTIFYWLYRAILTADVSFPWIYAPIGAALWIFRAPLKRQNAESGGESCRA